MVYKKCQVVLYCVKRDGSCEEGADVCLMIIAMSNVTLLDFRSVSSIRRRHVL